MPALPRRFGRYEIVEEIARGAHGVVYAARDLELGRTVALKVLRADEASPTAVERFHREARVAARLRHPHIMDVFEAGEEDGQAFFTMPLIRGASLARLLHEGNVETGPLARLLERIARAIHFAHERGVVHRDLKPTNVLVRDDGTPVVTDFGVAHDGVIDDVLTQTGELLGTPVYMAPEQVSGRARDADARTDVYALGVILYEALAGRPPFQASTFVDLSAKILNDPPEPPSRHRASIDPDLERICLRCLRKYPAERYGTAAELADDLGRVARGEKIVVPAETARTRIAFLLRKHRFLVVAVTAALTGAGLVLMGSAFAKAPVRAPVVTVETEPPGASVYVDGRFAGTTPLVRPGPGEVRVQLAGHAPVLAQTRPGVNRYRLVRPGEIPEEMVYCAEAELFVDRAEVTTEAYLRFVELTARRPPPWKRGRSLPVTEVSWEDAQAFAAWSGRRLPTAAEWAAAARGAQAARVHAPTDGPQAAVDAGTSHAGCVDMLGNLQEWTATVGIAGADFRVVCGGSWQHPANECTVDRREERHVGYRSRAVGFRCTMDPPWKRKK